MNRSTIHCLRNRATGAALKEESSSAQTPLRITHAKDRQLADQFKHSMRQSERHLARIEGLLRRSA